MLLAALLIFSAPCLALDPFRIIVRVTGKVASRQPGQDDWSPIWRSRVLTDGDMARTYQDARACVKLADGSQFTVGQDSVVEMTKFELTDAGRTVVFNLLVGKIRARGAKAVGKQSKFEVKTPNGVLAARGTDFYVKQTPGAQSRRPEMLASRVIADATQPGPAAMRTWLIVFDGRVDVTSSREKRSFSAGDWAIIEPDGTIRSRPSDVWTPEGPFASQGPDADLRRPDRGEGGYGGRPRPGFEAPPPIFAPGTSPPITQPPSGPPGPSNPNTPSGPSGPTNTIPTGPGSGG